MKRPVRLFLCGLLPAAPGFAMSMLLRRCTASALTWTALGMFAPLFWAFAGWQLASPREKPWQTVAFVHGPALLLWLLSLYQILWRGAWLQSALGGVCQCFFLPFLTPAMALAAAFPTPSLWPAFTLAFALMPASFWLGLGMKHVYFKKKGAHHDQDQH